MKSLSIALISALALNTACARLKDSPIFSVETKKKSVEALQTYTEAYIEFAGPMDRWAGPANWIVHAKVSDPPEISVTSSILGASSAPAPVVERVPSGVIMVPSPALVGPLLPPPQPVGPTAEKLREQIAALELWTQGSVAGGSDVSFRSCLSPIIIRILRGDGSSTERRGCREQSVWSSKVSALASDLASYANGEVPVGTKVADSAAPSKP